MEYIENISWAARMGQRRETKSSGAKPVRRNTAKRNEAVLSKETLERYRRMTTSERAALVVQSMRENWPAMFEGSEQKVARRFELLRRQNDERNRNMLEALARIQTDAS